MGDDEERGQREEGSAMSILRDFLDQRARGLSSEQAELERKRDEWISAIDRLRQQVRCWIEQADTGRILRVEDEVRKHREPGLGFYECTGLSIELGRRKVELAPVSRFSSGAGNRPSFIGVSPAFGRVDLTNGLVDYQIFRVEKEPVDRWMMLEPFTTELVTFARDSFEEALKSLLE